jgi:hypothetical protein
LPAGATVPALFGVIKRLERAAIEGWEMPWPWLVAEEEEES